MKPTPAKVLYDGVLQSLREALPASSKVEDGVFGARMLVSLTNDGPVTVVLDSRNGNGIAPVVPALLPPAEEKKQGHQQQQEEEPSV
mmetsp:Transcript_11752/g.38674  ORF Transcript_11752/g.38674 Transcript_11752/m.38674 type:complete len:87 (+) Transcript_11752:421-681(+)